jgi:hypothetical protein
VDDAWIQVLYLRERGELQIDMTYADMRRLTDRSAPGGMSPERWAACCLHTWLDMLPRPGSGPAGYCDLDFLPVMGGAQLS